MVMLGHARVLHLFVPPWLRQTYTGVDLFFVISGLVVCWSMKDKWPDFRNASFLERLSQGLRPMGQFYARRFFRIIPAAVLWSVIPIALVAFWGDQEGPQHATRYSKNFSRP